MNSRIYIAEEPPLSIAVDVCQGLLKIYPVKIAFAGKAGSGKSSIAKLLSDDEYPVFNHADLLKEEILEWLTEAIKQEHKPYSDECFYHFANFMGLSPARIQEDLWDMVKPVYDALIRMYIRVIKNNEYREIKAYTLDEKINFVDNHKKDFRESLQVYGTMVKEIAADPYYWVNKTISRSNDYRVCFNGDTRHREEMECMRQCGWIGVFLWIDEDTQKLRRPEMTESERNHFSEWGITAEDCDIVIDSTKSLSTALMELADYLSATPVRHKVELHADSTRD
jgi:adenylate kinase family enzyme